MGRSDDLLERAEELECLRELIGRVHAEPGCVVFEGAPGLGKTSLLREARCMAVEAGLTVLTARGTDLEKELPFGVTCQLFERYAYALSEDAQARLFAGSAAPALATIRPDLASSEQHTPSFAVLHGLYWMTVNVCERTPLMLIVDDMQWCDEATLRWLSYLLPQMDDLNLVLVMATRPTHLDERTSTLLGNLLESPMVRLSKVRPLSGKGTRDLLRRTFGGDTAGEFADACHVETSGNPLYLSELVKLLLAEGVRPDAHNIAGLGAMGGQAIHRRLAAQTSAMSPAAKNLAYAVAVLADQAELPLAVELSELDQQDVPGALAELRSAGILNVQERPSFTHPIVHSAIYSHLGLAERAEWHRGAALLLQRSGAAPAQAAVHILRCDPGTVPDAAGALRAAARQATAQGAPDSALTYLVRCLLEPQPDAERLTVLMAAGFTAHLTNVDAAVAYLSEALTLADGTHQRSVVAWQLGLALLLSGQGDRAEALWTGLIAELPDGDSNEMRLLHAGLGLAATLIPGRDDLRAHLYGLRSLSPQDTQGGRALDAALAVNQSNAGDPEAVVRARRVLSSEEFYLDNLEAVGRAWYVDVDEGMRWLDNALSRIHAKGAIRTLSTAYRFRAIAWLMRGSLHEAEADLRQAIWAAEIAGLNLARPMLGASLAEILVEQGRIDEAAAALEAIDKSQAAADHVMQFVLYARSTVWYAAGDLPQSLEAALQSGRRFIEYGGRNPAIIPWRSQAAMCLHLMGDDERAADLALEEVADARRWGAPGPLGRALRVAATVTGMKDFRMIEESVTVLTPSSARLEYAKTLAAYGAAVRRANHRAKARVPLRVAIEIATQCGAAPLVQQAQSELLATGAYRHQVTPAGPTSLTPQEWRVVKLATRDHTNRQIAQELFVTPKTVEVHLSSVYRKLGIQSRRDLVSALKSIREDGAGAL